MCIPKAQVLRDKDEESADIGLEENSSSESFHKNEEDSKNVLDEISVPGCTITTRRMFKDTLLVIQLLLTKAKLNRKIRRSYLLSIYVKDKEKTDDDTNNPRLYRIFQETKECVSNLKKMADVLDVILDKLESWITDIGVINKSQKSTIATNLVLALNTLIGSSTETKECVSNFKKMADVLDVIRDKLESWITDIGVINKNQKSTIAASLALSSNTLIGSSTETKEFVSNLKKMAYVKDVILDKLESLKTDIVVINKILESTIATNLALSSNTLIGSSTNKYSEESIYQNKKMDNEDEQLKVIDAGLPNFDKSIRKGLVDSHKDKDNNPKRNKMRKSKPKTIDIERRLKGVRTRVAVALNELHDALTTMGKIPVIYHTPNFENVLAPRRVLFKKPESSESFNPYFTRLQSFTLGKNARNRAWSNDRLVWVGPLVAAGFSYEGEGYTVVCRTCGCRCDTNLWTDNDEIYAMKKHRKVLEQGKTCDFLSAYSYDQHNDNDTDSS